MEKVILGRHYLCLRLNSLVKWAHIKKQNAILPPPDTDDKRAKKLSMVWMRTRPLLLNAKNICRMPAVFSYVSSKPISNKGTPKNVISSGETLLLVSGAFPCYPPKASFPRRIISIETKARFSPEPFFWRPSCRNPKSVCPSLPATSFDTSSMNDTLTVYPCTPARFLDMPHTLKPEKLSSSMRLSTSELWRYTQGIRKAARYVHVQGAQGEVSRHSAGIPIWTSAWEATVHKLPSLHKSPLLLSERKMESDIIPD